MESEVIPINPTIIRVMRVLRIARVLKLLKMAKGIRALLDTVMQALPQVGNLGLLFFLLFFIFAALGVELFGRLECTEEFPCQGLGEHAHFRNFGMAFLTLFRVATGDNWNGIMKDTLRENCDSSSDCIRNCCVSPIIAPLYFVVFVLMAQFVLVNVVVAVLMKHLEESHKHMDDDIEMDAEIERQLAAELADSVRRKGRDKRREARREEMKLKSQRPLVKMSSLPANFTFNFADDNEADKDASNAPAAVRVADMLYDPVATFSSHPCRSATSALSWPVSTSNIGGHHNHDGSARKLSVSELSPTPLVGSVISLCSSRISGSLYQSPVKKPSHVPVVTREVILRSRVPPILVFSNSSEEYGAAAATASPSACDADDVTDVAIGDESSPRYRPEDEDDDDDEDNISICDVLISEDLSKEGDEDSNSWCVEEEESATSTNGLLRNYPELRLQHGLDTVSWTASDDISSTTISGTLSGTEVVLEGDNNNKEPPKCISMSHSQSSLQLPGLDEAEEMEDVLVVDPSDQKAVLIIGNKRCTGVPEGEERGQRFPKSSEQC